MDLGHSLDLEHKTPATELGRYIKRYLDLGHLFSGPFVQNWPEFLGKMELFGDFLMKFDKKLAKIGLSFWERIELVGDF